MTTCHSRSKDSRPVRRLSARPSANPRLQKFLYVFGGNSYSRRPGTIERYKFNGKKWEPVAGLMPHSGYGSAYAVYQDCVWLSGGQDAKWSSLASTYTFDVDTAKWDEQPPMLQTRSFHGLAALDGKLYAVGGRIEARASDSVEVYDEANGWNPCKSMREKRCKFGVGVANRLLFAVGGRNKLRKALDSAEYYSIITLQWTTIQNELHFRRFDFRMVTIQRRIYAVGGDAYQCIEKLEWTDGFEPGWNWEIEMGFPTVRDNSSVVGFGNFIVAVGGLKEYQRSVNVGLIDTVTGYATPLPNMGKGRAGAGVAIITEQT